MRTFLAIALMLLPMLCDPASAAWRVVVQEALIARPNYLPDGRLAWCTVGANDHLLHVFEPGQRRVLAHFHLPSRILSAAPAAASERVVVATDDAVYLGSLATGKMDRVLPEVTGMVALDPEGKRLAVAGTVGLEGEKDRSYRLERTVSLGVYDLEAKQWLARVRTRMVRAEAVLFEGDEVVALGIGGNPYHMLPVTYATDTRLDLRTGKAVTTSGPARRFGRPITPETAATFAKQVQEDGNGKEKFVFDPRYEVPASFQIRRKMIEAVMRKHPTPALKEFFGPDTSHRFIGPLPCKEAAAGVALPLHRLNIRLGLQTAGLTIRKDGSLHLGETRIAGHNTPFRQSATVQNLEKPREDLVHPVDGTLLAPISGKDKVQVFTSVGEGTLVREGRTLRRYLPGKKEPLWSTEAAGEKWMSAAADPTGTRLVLGCWGESILGVILDARTGKRIAAVPRPAGLQANWTYLRFDAEGKKLAFVRDYKRLVVFDAATGMESAEESVDLPQEMERRYWTHVLGWSGGWWVGGFRESRNYDPGRKEWSGEFPIGAVALQEIPGKDGPRLVVQDGYGGCCLVDPRTGKTLGRWTSAEGSQHLPGMWNLPFADGRALVRPRGWSACWDVFDLRTLETVVNLHAVPVGKDLGWIAWTPDGWWDASPGAEHLAAVFEGTRPADREETARRRDPNLLRERLQALWR